MCKQGRRMTDRGHALEAFKLYKDTYVFEYNSAILQEDYDRADEIWAMLEDINRIEEAIYAFFEGRG